MTSSPRQQKRGRKIAMTAQEMDSFLAAERTCRVATVGPDGPHATPLWFCWHAGLMWLYSITRSQRWADPLLTAINLRWVGSQPNRTSARDRHAGP